MGLIGNIFMVIIIVIVIVLVYNYLNSITLQLTNLQSGTKEVTVKASKLPANKNSSNYAYSIWFYVKNWQYRLADKKELLNRTSGSLNTTGSPRITLAAYENNININIPTYPTSAPPTDSKHVKDNSHNNIEPEESSQIKDDTLSSNHDCTIRNFPLQKWVNLIVSLNGRTLDVYLDGKLVRTCLLPGVAKVDSAADVRITPGGGFSGWTSNMKYWAKPLNPEEAYNVYKDGYNSSGLAGLFNKYKIKVSYLVDNEEEGSFSI